jgi:uncharacterized membrane protein YqgA involved in biofilm formation
VTAAGNLLTNATGTILNVTGILIGGVFGLVRRKPLSPPQESFFRVLLGAFTVYFGLRLAWLSLAGSLFQIAKQIGIVILALILGKLAGRLLHFQKLSNRAGQFAREAISGARPDDPHRVSHGFETCALLFCAAPLGILGAIQDGLSGYFYPLALKGVLEGLATMGFVSVFGWGALLAALPVLALQGSIALGCARFIEPFLQAHGLVNSVDAVGGLLVFCVALVILDLKKIPLADYLPSLFIAPVLTWGLGVKW